MKLPARRIAISALPVGCFVLVAACGGSSDPSAPKQAQAQTQPTPPVDGRPRVDGRWRVVYRPRDYTGKTIRTTWRITPTCVAGPCAFKVRSSTKGRFSFRFDDAIGDYTLSERRFVPCARSDGRVTVRRGYAVDRQLNLQVTGSTKTSTGRAATRMRGSDVSLYRTTRKASLANCSDSPKETDRVIAVRLSP